MASLPQEYNQIIGGRGGGGGGGNMKRTNIRPICNWQIKSENEQWFYFVFADLQQYDNLKDIFLVSLAT